VNGRGKNVLYKGRMRMKVLRKQKNNEEREGNNGI
jgi:hypothetical protein